MKNLFFLFILSAGVVNAFAQVDFTATESCYGDQTTLEGNSFLSDADIASWNWDLNNDGIYDEKTGKTVMWQFNQAGTVSVGLKIIIIAGGEDSVSKPVTIRPLPEVNFYVDNLCEGKEASFISQATISSGTISEYKWDFNNDGQDDDTGDIVYYTCGPGQTYITKLTCVSDIYGCSSSRTQPIKAYHQPVADFSVTNTCLGDSTLFANSTTITGENIAFYLWDFGDGNQAATFGNPTHKFDADLTYTVSLIAISENNCKDTTFASVVIDTLPNVTLGYDPDTIIALGDDVIITVVGDVITYRWLGETGNSLGETSNITVSNSGIFSVEVTDINGCKLTRTANIKVIEEINVINNILTPNNDGINDFLIIEDIEAYDNCEITIYNRWNDVVYSNSDYYNDWDGGSLDGGTYFYIIKCDEFNEKIGSINILR